eukprot:CAMPEP_0196761340 /NCGR_PEP_ID=MMETSP1095-20130614/543_1 /TAXON_ID=96789 ORGANISM="Chromulina nebulosa, Strain UTEXLB2642" /NCGR_SAMPLE_ID=MMETSP1095 /ASSEMBLY_ACC=CAM_ASM_000446 /LENGTH=379 /DNA_ID=CAMNT_0042110747 /DNA_START=527 /DNA_END=1662 /DNA_ORIENTATION=-
MGLHLLNEDAYNDPKANEVIIDTIEMMRESTNYMSKTLNDILSLQKIEDGKLELHYDTFYITELVSSVVLSNKKDNTNNDIIVKLYDNVPDKVIGDRFRIEHVLNNLLFNSMKHSPIGSHIKLNVTYSNSLFTFSIIDEGKKLSKHEQTIFEDMDTNYVNSSDTSTHSWGGTMGITICKEIIRLHGGEIKYKDNDKDKGCEIYISIPFTIWNSENEPKTTGNNKLKSIKSLTPRSKRMIDSKKNHSMAEFSTNSRSFDFEVIPKILIVDDVESNRKVLKKILEKKGLECECAENGLLAVENVKSKGLDHYTIIFMDHQMPIMDGLTATAKLRENGYNKLIVGLTGNTMDEDIKSFKNAGANEVYSKPLDVSILYKLLKS